jgi:hypothetical protein
MISEADLYENLPTSLTDITESIISQLPALTPLLLHIFHSLSFEEHPVDAYLIKTIITEDNVSTITLQDGDGESTDLLRAITLAFITRSYQLYLQGQPTFHQYLLQRMTTATSHQDICDQSNFYFALLFFPFNHLNNPYLIQQHILLTAHAGFLHIPTSPPLGLHDSFEGFCQWLLPVRSFFLNHLLTMTNLLTYFPLSQRLQAQNALRTIPCISSYLVLDFARDWKTIPPNPISYRNRYNSSTTPSTAQTPANNTNINTNTNSEDTTTIATLVPLAQSIQQCFPHVHSLLYDDYGKIHALKLNEQQHEEQMENAPTPSPASPAPADGDTQDQDADFFKIAHIHHDSPTWSSVFQTGSVKTSREVLPPYDATISDTALAWIQSEDNVKAMNLHHIHPLQAQLTALFKQSASNDRQQVEATIKRVLITADLIGIIQPISTTNIPSLSSSPISNSYPFPIPISNPAAPILPALLSPPPTLTLLPPSPTSDWALEMLVIASLNITPPDYLVSIDPTPTPNLPNPSTFDTFSTHFTLLSPHAHPFFNNPATHPLRLQRATAAILNPMHLSNNLLTLLVNGDNLQPDVDDDEGDYSAFHFEELLMSSTINILLLIFDTLASIDASAVSPPP